MAKTREKTDAQRQRLLERLNPHTPNAADWQHPHVELELGMGDGLALLERAKATPNRLFIGCEVYLNGVQVALNNLERTPLPNVRLTNTDARELLDSLPAGCLERVLIPFPDPWPKAKHHKRRLVQAPLLDTCARALQDGGELWVITDWPPYAYHSMAVLFGHDGFTLEGCGLEAAACKPSARLEERLGPRHLATAPTWWIETKYQAKAASASRETWYINAVKKS